EGGSPRLWKLQNLHAVPPYSILLLSLHLENGVYIMLMRDLSPATPKRDHTCLITNGLPLGPTAKLASAASKFHPINTLLDGHFPVVNFKNKTESCDRDDRI